MKATGSEQAKPAANSGKQGSQMKTDIKVINRDIRNILWFTAASIAIIAALYFLM
ncbi:hypothetical protein WJ0W_002641 [Paenibacillus melissococcoides]|uniref:Uncharacterized protein n=1 Tax=Paenibacillus melissococcoides TaxID=2912268 RepID=A0ABM9G1B8_9BACL|nr:MULTISPECIES: hypothetical protein [Paenibacillus]MEB9892413.1 hypothetical protein [Bacillus cereus]CAH8245406.1 hypothetical protein WJ0W_002641 [Paenibacillus melissococcoides]CAH8710849.1 hypothetical protein WDD9_002721 [Paenibacillus melissococcoides]CAH8711652.1 hypothetical protein HTL2_003022 [Paenibacillus melissococcoides]GIO77694.1 hypothetical protein J6TS7_13040 [Paenibacillus dendritiformis]